MPLLRAAPYRAIAVELADRLAAARGARDPLAPWDEEVIVPSRGMADAIAAAVLERIPTGVAGLHLQSVETLARRVLNAAGQMPRVATDAERRLAMRMAVRGIDDALLASRGIAAMLERAYRDVRDSGLTLTDFRRRAESTRGLRNPRRTELVTRAFAEYERLIERFGAIDPADLLQRAARMLNSSQGLSLPTQVVAGFYDMTGVQLQFTEALLRAKRISAVFVPSQAAFARTFIRAIETATGATFETAEPDGLPPLQTLTECKTRLDEIRHVCGEVRRLLSRGTPASEIGIVARTFDGYDAHLLNRIAEEHGFHTTLGDPVPLAAHRIGRGALTLLRLRDRGFPRGEVLELVRDGLRTQTRIAVDATDRATRRARIAGGTSQDLLAMRNRSAAVDSYIALVSELEELTETPLASLLPRLSSLFRVETDADLAAAEALDEIAQLFVRAGSAALPDVIDAIENESLPQLREAEGETIRAGELLRFRGRTFRHLFVLRMEDEVFPQRRNEDPLLPDSDRRLLGVRVIGDGREEEELLFSLLASSASDAVHSSFAAGDGFGAVMRPSRFTRHIARATPALLAATRPSPANVRRQLQLVVQSGTRSAFDGYVMPMDTASLRALSPTQLEDFGECPQKFFLKHILHVEDLEHPERELQIHQRDKGILDHRVLEQFYRAMHRDDYDAARLAMPRLAETLAQRLDTIIDQQFDAHEREVPPFNPSVRSIERRATHRLLREFVLADLTDLFASGLLPQRFEYRFGAKHRDVADHPEPYVVEASGVPLRVEGTIDRVDEGDRTTEDGQRVHAFRIVDYKSGKGLRHTNLSDKIDRGVRLQLALYAMAIADFFGANAEQVTGTIKPLVISELKPASFAFALAEKRDTLLETLQIFVRAILDGSFPAFPNENSEFDSCRYCPVNHSCRTRHDIDEKYLVLQFGDPRTLLTPRRGEEAASAPVEASTGPGSGPLSTKSSEEEPGS